jgi:endonuclease/exonuclease/phosphatase family metal-dependent hydrolase
VLHWNVHSWRDLAGQPNLDAVAGLIAARQPDVVSLTEVIEPWAAPAAIGDLASRAGYWWMFVPAVELGGDEPARGYGNALLCRLPVLAVQQWQLTWPPAVYHGTEPSEARSVALARIRLPAADVWAGSTHLPLGQQARSAALGRLAALTRSLPAPWVISGDFNTAPGNWIRPGQPVVVAPRPARPTFPARFPRRALDYTIASPGIRMRAKPLRAAGSDHRPVLTRCQVPARRG